MSDQEKTAPEEQKQEQEQEAPSEETTGLRVVSEASESEQTKKEAQVMSLIRVRFWGNPRPHTFVNNGLRLSHRQMVVAESDRGLSLGMVNSFSYEKKIAPDTYKTILRVANDDDLAAFEKAQKEAVEVKKKSRSYVEELNIEMSVSHVTPIDFGKKFVIYFTAPQRVDFRDLLKKLRNDKLDIELRHINPQQKMEALGILGSCGHTSSDYILTAKRYERKDYSVKSAFSRV